MNEVDVMSFPNYFEEFIDDYSFIDKDEIYTNGCKLIQAFRVKQGYDHFSRQIKTDLLDKVSRRFHSRILFRELTRAELMNIFDDLISEMKAENEKGEENNENS